MELNKIFMEMIEKEQEMIKKIKELIEWLKIQEEKIYQMEGVERYDELSEEMKKAVDIIQREIEFWLKILP